MWRTSRGGPAAAVPGRCRPLDFQLSRKSRRNDLDIPLIGQLPQAEFELGDALEEGPLSEVWPEWSDEERADASRLKALLAPYPAEEMVRWPVSSRVGNVTNNDPSLVQPIASAA